MRYQVSYLQCPASLTRNSNRGADLSRDEQAYLDVTLGGFKPDFVSKVSFAAACNMYKVVVELDADDLEDVFEKCNSIDNYWADNLPGATTFPNGYHGHRSMSVGDLVRDENGNHFVVASFGFKPVSLPKRG
jgi:hypothetical protein